MPIQCLPLRANLGPVFHVVCDNAPCKTGILMSAGKSRERAIEAARSSGFRISGNDGAESVSCPECAKVTAAIAS